MKNNRKKGVSPFNKFPFLIGKVLTVERAEKLADIAFPFLIGKVLTIRQILFICCQIICLFPFLIGKVLTVSKAQAFSAFPVEVSIPYR